MAVISIKVRALADGALDKDMVVVKDGSGRYVRFAFNVSPKGTADSDVVLTKVDQNLLTAVSTAIVGKQGTVIKNNPDWDDVKTDTDDDGVNDTGLYNWVQEGHLYEIVT